MNRTDIEQGVLVRCQGLTGSKSISFGSRRYEPSWQWVRVLPCWLLVILFIIPSISVRVSSVIADEVRAQSLDKGSMKKSIDDLVNRDWRVVDCEVEVTGQDGGRELVRSRYIELCTGLNYWDGEKWERSEAAFDEAEDEYAGNRTVHKVRVPKRLDRRGWLEVDFGGGYRQRSRPMCVIYYDEGSGESVVLGEYRGSVGRMVSSDTIIYEDAFDGLRCDLRVVIRLDGIESDVIIRERPMEPEDYGIGGKDVRLEVISEVEWDRVPEVRTVQVNKAVGMGGSVSIDEEDDEVGLGDYRLDSGRVVYEDGQGRRYGVRVNKRIGLVRDGNGREHRVLIEGVQKAQLDWMMGGLSKAGGIGVAGARRYSSRAELIESMISGPVKVGSGEGRSMSLAGGDSRGVVIDYVAVASTADMVFKRGTTYLVSGQVNLSGNTIFEGGSVIKYTTGGKLRIVGTVEYQSGIYDPVYYVSRDDNSVGEVISGSSGVPVTYAGAIEFDSYPQQINYTVKYVRVRDAMLGINYFNSYSQNVLYDGQFSRCGTCVGLYWNEVSLRNVLMSSSGTGVQMSGGSNYGVLRYEQGTVDQVSQLIYDYGQQCWVYMTNIIVSSSGMGTYNPYMKFGDCVYDIGTGAGVYDVVGYGKYYISIGQYEGLGSSSVSWWLTNEIKDRSIRGPRVISGVLTGVVELVSEVERGRLDWLSPGYYYGALDYLISNAVVIGTEVVIRPGAVVGVAGTFVLGSNGKVRAAGEAGRQVRIVNCANIQEGVTNSSTGALMSLGSMAVAEMRFCLVNGSGRNLYCDSGSNWRIWLRDSEVVGCRINGWCNNGYGNEIGLTNNLILGCNISYYQENIAGYYPFVLRMYNNLIKGGGMSYTYKDSRTAWVVKDNMFDSDSLGVVQQGAIEASNNGYRSGLTSLGGSSNKVISAVSYESGSYGKYYIPQSGGMGVLVDGGSRSASAAGLYHYTTSKAAGSKEGGSQVDIGYHYAGIDSGNKPIDSDGDGVADYIEDVNGNGLADDSRSWLNYESVNGLSTGNWLIVYTPLK